MRTLGRKAASIWTATAVVSLLALGAASVLATVPAAHASSNVISITTSDGATVCPGSLNGTWAAATDTCSITGTLAVSSGTTLDVGPGVTVVAAAGGGGDASGVANLGVVYNHGNISGSTSNGNANGVGNLGVIYNYGSLTGTTSAGSGTAGIGNYGGNIDNYGTMRGSTTGGSSTNGIWNGGGTVNNGGTMTGTTSGSGSYTGGIGISKGAINNRGIMTGSSSSGGSLTNGIYDGGGAINNDGTMRGTSTGGGGSGIYNPTGSVLNDYCGVSPTYSSYSGSGAKNAIPCYAVTFGQAGVPSGVTWGVTASWGPFVLPENHTGSGATIAVQATGPINYTYFTPIMSSGTAYQCASGCSGTAAVSSPTAFSATYSAASSTTATASSTTTSVTSTSSTIPSTTAATTTSTTSEAPTTTTTTRTPTTIASPPASSTTTVLPPGTTTPAADYTPYIIGGVALLIGVIVAIAFATRRRRTRGS